jgi:hypothetical protein
MHQYCYGQLGQPCVLHYWGFRNHHLSKPFQAICCPMPPIHPYSKSGLKWNAPNAISHLTHMPKHANSLMSNHHHSLTNYQSPFIKYILNRSLSFCTSRIHAHQSIGHVMKIIVLPFLHSNYNNYIKKCKTKISITFQHFPNFLKVILNKILHYSPGNSLGFRQQIEGGSSIPHDHTNPIFKLSNRYFI